MGLLTALKLPAASNAAIKPMPTMDITDTQGAEVSSRGVRPIAVKAAEPAGLQKQLEDRGEALRDANARIEKALPALEARMKGLSGSSLATAEAQKKDLEKAQAAIGRQLKQNDADLKAVQSPATDAKAMNDILARAKQPVGAGKAVEVDRHDDAVEKKRSQSRETTTTTEYKDGKSTTTVDSTTKKVGLDGATRTRTRSTEEVTAEERKSASSTSTTRVGLGNVSHTEERKTSSERNGQKVETSRKGGVEVGLGGAGVSGEEKKTNADGSGSSTSHATKVERGDGKVGVSSTTSHGRTNAEGNETKGTATAKAGASVDPDGTVGAQGSGQLGVDHKRKSGISAGAVGGLNPAISCNIAEKGDLYVVSLNVDLGASITVKGGYDKDQSGEMQPKARPKVGVSAGASGRVWMRQSWNMTADEVSVFTGAIRGAGGTVKGTAHEIAVVRMLIAKGPEAAQALWLGKPVGGADDVAGMRAGDSKSVGSSKGASGSVDVDGKVVGISVSGETTREREMTVTKDADGGATYDTHQGSKHKGEVGGKVSVGMAEGSVAIGKTITTKSGYKFRVKPEAKNAVALQNEIAALHDAPEAKVRAFAERNAGNPDLEITKIDARDDTDSTRLGAGALGAKATFADSHGIETTTTTGPDGKVDKRQRGHNAGGMTLEAGGISIGSDFEESAGGRNDAQGARVVDVSRSESETDFGKLKDKLLGRKPKGEEKGALATAAGTGGDTRTGKIQGVTLSESDLRMLGDLARDKRRWGHDANSSRYRDDWMKAAAEIRAAKGDPVEVENALARFVGSDSARAQLVLRTVRPVGDVSSGSRWEFPDELKSKQKAFQDLVGAACEQQIAARAKEKGPAEAGQLADALLAQLQALHDAVSKATFENGATQAEMLSAIAARQSRVEVEKAKAAGRSADEAEKGQESADYQRLYDLCTLHQKEETEIFGKIKGLTGGKDDHMSRASMDEVMALTVQVKNLHATWQKDYDRMAMLAQERGLGQGYAALQPDKKRLDATVKTFKAGDATPGAREEKRDLTRASKAAEARKYEMLQDIGKTDDQLFKDIKKNVEVTRHACVGLKDELKTLLDKAPYPTVKTFYDQAVPLFDRAEQKVRQCGNSYDAMFDLGAAALEEFKECLALLKKAKGFVPKTKKA